MIFKWLGIFEIHCVHLSAHRIDTLDLLSSQRAEGSTCSHDLHDIIRFFHTPNGVFDLIEDSRDGINSSNCLLLEIFKNVLAWDVDWPKPAFFYDCSCKNTLLFESNESFQDAKAIIKNMHQDLGFA